MRGINKDFIDSLLYGEISYFYNAVRDKTNSLSLEIRGGYVSIYYKGGSLLKITQMKRGKKRYKLEFDAKYCKNKGNDGNFDLLNSHDAYDVDAFVSHFDLMKQEMDTWFNKHSKPERDHQHKLLLNNPEIVDIEYQVGNRMRFDMLYVKGDTLYIVENKFGKGAIGGNAGMAKHYYDICKIIADDRLREKMINSVYNISEAKLALGLVDEAISRGTIEKVKILFLLVDCDPDKNVVQNEVANMKGIISASLLTMNSNKVKIDLDEAKALVINEN